MKLTPKPQPKARETSRGNSSTQPSVKASSYTAPRKRTPVILSDVSYTGVDQQGTAVDTEYQKSQKKTEPTTFSCAVIAPKELHSEEASELFNLGVLCAQMKWIQFYSDCERFNAGVRRGEGVSLGLPMKKVFDRAILYKSQQPIEAKERLEIPTHISLYNLVAEAGKELYKRGILR